MRTVDMGPWSCIITYIVKEILFLSNFTSVTLLEDVITMSHCGKFVVEMAEHNLILLKNGWNLAMKVNKPEIILYRN